MNYLVRISFLGLIFILAFISGCVGSVNTSDLTAEQKKKLHETVSNWIAGGVDIVPIQPTYTCNNAELGNAGPVRVPIFSVGQELCASKITLTHALYTDEEFIYNLNFYDGERLVYQAPVRLRSLSVDSEDSSPIKSVQFQITEAEAGQSLFLRSLEIRPELDPGYGHISFQTQWRASQGHMHAEMLKKQGLSFEYLF